MLPGHALSGGKSELLLLPKEAWAPALIVPLPQMTAAGAAAAENPSANSPIPHFTDRPIGPPVK